MMREKIAVLKKETQAGRAKVARFKASIESAKEPAAVKAAKQKADEKAAAKKDDAKKNMLLGDAKDETTDISADGITLVPNRTLIEQEVGSVARGNVTLPATIFVCEKE